MKFLTLMSKPVSLLLASSAWTATAQAAEASNGATSVVATQAALQGSAANGLGTITSDTLASVAAASGYDWTLLIALVLGLVGLVWMRRHIAKL